MPLSVVSARCCSKIEVENSRGSDKSDIDEKSLILDMLEVAFDFDSDTICLGYPRRAEYTERSHRHHYKCREFLFAGSSGYVDDSQLNVDSSPSLFLFSLPDFSSVRSHPAMTRCQKNAEES